MGRHGGYYGGNSIIRELCRYMGQTVTIYTTSGGESGEGFTGVLIGINGQFVRLLSDFGPAPACALGSCCMKRKKKHHKKPYKEPCYDGYQVDGPDGEYDSYDSYDEVDYSQSERRIQCGCGDVGAVVDIPICRIAAFVHNTVGASFY